MYKIFMLVPVLAVIFSLYLARRNKKISQSTMLFMAAILILYVVLPIMFIEDNAIRGVAALDRQGRQKAQKSKKIEFNGTVVPLFENTYPKRRFNISLRALDVFTPLEKSEDHLYLSDKLRRISISFYISPIGAYNVVSQYDSLIDEGSVGPKEFKEYIYAPPRPQGRSRPEPTYKFQMSLPLAANPVVIVNCDGSAMKEIDLAELRTVCLSVTVQPVEAGLSVPTPDRTFAK